MDSKKYIRGGDMIVLQSTEYGGCLSADIPYKMKVPEVFLR